MLTYVEVKRITHLKSYLATCALCLAVFTSTAYPASAQNGPESGTRPVQAAQESKPTLIPPNYVLGPDDIIVLLSSEVDELNKNSLRIALDGEINLPLLGRMHAGGLTVHELEQQIQNSLKNFVRHPDVVVTVSEYHSQPVSVLGELSSPGVFQLQGNKTLYEMISMAGGLGPQAGSTITISRKLQWGPLPLPDAKNDATGEFSVGHVSVKNLMHATDPAENIKIQPQDVISVSREDNVYVIGSVNKPGAVPLVDEKSITTLQALSEAWGLSKAASPSKAKLMRLIPGSNGARTETPIDLKKLLVGKIPDLQLQANDILVVPSSVVKTVAGQATQSAIQVGTAVAIVTK